MVQLVMAKSTAIGFAFVARSHRDNGIPRYVMLVQLLQDLLRACTQQVGATNRALSRLPLSSGEAQLQAFGQAKTEKSKGTKLSHVDPKDTSRSLCLFMNASDATWRGVLMTRWHLHPVLPAG